MRQAMGDGTRVGVAGTGVDQARRSEPCPDALHPARHTIGPWLVVQAKFSAAHGNLQRGRRLYKNPASDASPTCCRVLRPPALRIGGVSARRRFRQAWMC